MALSHQEKARLGKVVSWIRCNPGPALVVVSGDVVMETACGCMFAESIMAIAEFNVWPRMTSSNKRLLQKMTSACRTKAVDCGLKMSRLKSWCRGHNMLWRAKVGKDAPLVVEVLQHAAQQSCVSLPSKAPRLPHSPPLLFQHGQMCQVCHCQCHVTNCEQTDTLRSTAQSAHSSTLWCGVGGVELCAGCGAVELWSYGGLWSCGGLYMWASNMITVTFQCSCRVDVINVLHHNVHSCLKSLLHCHSAAIQEETNHCFEAFPSPADLVIDIHPKRAGNSQHDPPDFRH